MLTKKKFLILEIIALAFIVLIVSIFYLNQTWMGLIFNSDILTIPDIFNDLIHGGHFQDWAIATTAMFFPDWLVFFLAYKMTNDLYFLFLIIACVNSLLLYLIVRLIYGQFYEQKEALIFSVTSILFFLFFVTKCLEPYIFLAVLGQHVGGFIIELAYLYLLLKEKNTSLIMLFVLITIAILMGASDILFIVQFLLPILVTFSILYWKKNIDLKKIIAYSLIPFLTSISAFFITNKFFIKSKIYNLLENSNLNTISFSIIKNKINFLIISCKVFSQFYWPVIFYSSFYISIITTTSFWLFDKKYFYNQTLHYDKKNIFLSLFITNCIAITILSFIFFDKDQAIRHLEPFFFFPILIYFFIGTFLKNIKFLTKKFNMLAYCILILLLTYFFIGFKKIYNVKMTYYPYEVSCIDKALKNHDHYGVANYWTARPFTMFSRIKIHITEVFNNLTPFSLATNLQKVSSKNAYSFVVMNLTPIIPTPNAIELNETDIVNFNGPPQKKIICGSKKLLIYKENSFKIPVFKIKGDSFYWPAYLLPSQFTNSTHRESIERFVKSGDGQGFVSFGPYVTLLPGKYRVYIVYKSNLSSNKKIGFWDISSNLANTVNSNFDLVGTNNKYQTFSKTFIVPKKSFNNLYEIRIYTNGTSNIFLKGIKLYKLKN